MVTRSLAAGLLFCATFASCGAPTAVGTMVDLSDPVLGEPLLGGLTFLMTSDQFFDYCLAANKRGEMSAGRDNYVRLMLADSVIAMNTVAEFYPDFDSDRRLVSLPGRIYSQSWAPWNPDLAGAALLVPAVAYLHGELGGSRFELLSGAPLPTYVKHDGPRRVYARPHPSVEQFVDFSIDLVGDCAPCEDADLLALPQVNPIMTKQLQGYR